MKRLRDILKPRHNPVVEPSAFKAPRPTTIDGRPVEIGEPPTRIKEDTLYVFLDKWRPLQIFDKAFYKLVPGRPPGLVINGFRMHVRGLSAYLREATARLAGLRVWDTCGGLGYSAKYLRGKFSEVIVSEKSRAVLELAAYNPFSHHLFGMQTYWANAWEMLGALDNLDAVFHDPPSFSQAPDLYSAEFLRELAARLRPGGMLYHYTGAPGIRRGRRLYVRIAKQMREMGFAVKKLQYGLLGVKK